MKKSKFTEAQIVFALRQAEEGVKVAEVCRKMGISDATFYNWKKKYSGLGISELRRLKQLEEENRQLKQLVADLSLDKQMLQDIIKKSFSKQPEKGPCRKPDYGIQGVSKKSLQHSYDDTFNVLLPTSSPR